MSSRIARRQHGLTLIEAILFMMIVGVALAGIVGVLNLTTKGSTDPLRRKQALMIAEGLLEEVQQAKFSYCDATDPKADSDKITSSAQCTVPENWGPEPGGSRPFDNVNDYVSAPGVAQSGFDDQNGILRDANGEAIDVEGYTATVTITPESLGGIAVPGAASADAEVLRIRVEVRFDGA